MDLTTLKGNTLKLYLHLVAQRDQQDRCCLSRRALHRLTGLARDTIDHAFSQLQHHGLLVPQAGGWQIELPPLWQLLRGNGEESSGGETGPDRVEGGLETRPVALKNGPVSRPSTACLNAPTRTLWSSSSEEDVQENPHYPYTAGGAGGDPVPAGFLVEMESVWKAIAPQEREAPREWFRTLHRDFGPQLPLAVLRQFAQSQRTLQHLRHPPSYKSYFTSCCQRAREQGTPSSRQGSARRPAPAFTAADHDLSDFFTPDPPASQAGAN